MEIKITRCSKHDEVLEGFLSIEEDRHLCETAENKATALPVGKYRIEVRKCKQHARKMLLIRPLEDAEETPLGDQMSPKCEDCKRPPLVNYNTPMPVYCPQICVGNGVYGRRDGAIIVGTKVVPGCLKHSRQAFAEIFFRLNKNTLRGNDITLEIAGEPK